VVSTSSAMIELSLTTEHGDIGDASAEEFIDCAERTGIARWVAYL
jgi:hypothetical protein